MWFGYREGGERVVLVSRRRGACSLGIEKEGSV